MSKRELNEARAENTELRRLFRRIYPSGNRHSPDRFWKLIRRLSEHVQWLEDLSTPLSARPSAVSTVVNVDQETSVASMGGRSANQPLLPGVYLLDRPGDRNLYHQGSQHQRELDRIYHQLARIIDHSADWIRGLDLDPEQMPSTQRSRCACGELLATAWRLCPYCGREIG